MKPAPSPLARALGSLVSLMAIVRVALDVVGWTEVQARRAARRARGVRRPRPRLSAPDDRARVVEAPKADGGSRTAWASIGLALSAAGLYAIGAVSTAGQLRASGLPISDTFGLVPLEDHITNGLGVALDVGPLLVVLIALIAGRFLAESVGSDERRARVLVLPRWRLWLSLWPNVIAALAAFAGPWWAGPALLVVWVGEVAGLQLSRRGPGAWRRHPVVVRFGVLLVTFAAFLFASGYWLADPLPRAALVKADGAPNPPPAALIAHSDGAFFLGAPGSGAVYRAWPQDQLESVTVEEQRRAPDRSLPRIIGVPFGAGGGQGDR